MNKTIKVTYNSDTLETIITVDGKAFDTSRIAGKEIAYWAYPLMIRKIRWNGFYDEMVEALGGEKEFNLVFEGSEADLNELKEAWEDAPVTIVSEENSENVVVIEYDENNLTTNITINGQPFDTSRINGREIAYWVYPLTIRKVKWNGIFEELAAVIGSEEYTIQFSGSNSAMQELMEECPETVSITLKKVDGSDICNTVCLSQEIFSEFYADIDDGKMTEHIVSEIKEAVEKLKVENKTIFPVSVKAVTGILGVLGNDTPCTATSIEELINCISEIYKSWDSPRANVYRRDCGIPFYSGFTVEIVTPAKNIFSDNDVSETQSVSNNAYELEEQAQQLNKEEKYEEAFKIRLKAADIGYFLSISNLGWHYNYGKGVEQDLNKAFEYYKRAAEMDNAWSQNKLGDCYYKGEGVAQDYAKAFEWYTKAAEQGNADAQYKLGNCYYYSEGVAKNEEKAFEWYTKAAEQGNEEAQDILEMLEACKPSIFDKAVNALTSDTAKEIGKGFLKGVGTFLGAAAQGYSQAKSYYDDDDEDY